MQDRADVYDSGDFYPVEFCVQADDSFIVQNRLGTSETADDVNIVQICPNGQLHLNNPTRAVESGCNTITLRRAEVPPSYVPPSTSPSNPPVTPPKNPPYTSACVPVPDGQEFRMFLRDNGDFLTGFNGGAAPNGNDGQQLTFVTTAAEAIIFRSAPGRNGQITVLSADDTTLYSDQDLGGSGDGPIYFDNLLEYENSNMYPVQFCLQTDRTFVVQNLGADQIISPGDDANVVQRCPDGILHLNTEANAVGALARGCTTETLVYEDAI